MYIIRPNSNLIKFKCGDILYFNGRFSRLNCISHGIISRRCVGTLPEESKLSPIFLRRTPRFNSHEIASDDKIGISDTSETIRSCHEFKSTKANPFEGRKRKIVSRQFNTVFHCSIPQRFYGTLSEVSESLVNTGVYMNPSMVYVNNVCMEMDKLMFRARNHDELLTLLVTHRGVMYLHNLVSAMKLLRAFVENDVNETVDIDDLYAGYNLLKQKDREVSTLIEAKSEVNLTKTEKELIERANTDILAHLKDINTTPKQHNRKLSEIIINDERYKLLIHDLCVNRGRLDLVSICEILISLDVIGHRCYVLYNGLLRRLLEMEFDLSLESGPFVRYVTELLIKVCHCYSRAGFNDIPLYNKICSRLFNLDGIKDNQLLIDIVKLYSSVKTYNSSIFYKLSQMVEFIEQTPNNVSWIAVAFSAHETFTKLHDRIMYKVADYIKGNSNLFNTRELCRCILSFSRMKLYFPKLWILCGNKITEEMLNSINTMDNISLSIAELSQIIKVLTSFDHTSTDVLKLVDTALLYLEDHIDHINENAAINLALSVCLTDRHGVNEYMLSYIWRLMGSGASWEGRKFEVFNIFLYHVLKFPDFRYNPKKLCVIGSLREWLIRYKMTVDGKIKPTNFIRNYQEQELIGVDRLFQLIVNEVQAISKE